MPGTPWLIENALVTAKQARLVAYLASEGGQGVLGTTHLRVTQQATPAGSVLVLPGAFAITNTAVGGEWETYAEGFATAETLPVTPTGAAARTDLVIARVENPSAVGTGSWAIPADPLNGPYRHLRVIEGVTPSNIPDVKTWNATWTAIPLARITRPANTGIVTDAHITDLRSLVSFAADRVTIINNPPPTPTDPAPDPVPNPVPTVPPLAHDVWTGVLHLPTAATLGRNQTSWISWPDAAKFDVPVPSWATTCDILGSFNPQFDGDIWGEVRLSFGGNAASAVVFDENAHDVWQRVNIPVVGTYDVPSGQRGQIVKVKLQAHMLDPSGHDGTLKTRQGVYLALQVNFKRSPGA